VPPPIVLDAAQVGAEHLARAAASSATTAAVWTTASLPERARDDLRIGDVPSFTSSQPSCASRARSASRDCAPAHAVAGLGCAPGGM
jgi:hypothetical protein